MIEFKVVCVVIGIRALFFNDTPMMGLVRLFFSWPCANGCLMLRTFSRNRL